MGRTVTLGTKRTAKPVFYLSARDSISRAGRRTEDVAFAMGDVPPAYFAAFASSFLRFAQYFFMRADCFLSR
jgi:hypothetical protein